MGGEGGTGLKSGEGSANGLAADCCPPAPAGDGGTAEQGWQLGCVVGLASANSEAQEPLGSKALCVNAFTVLPPRAERAHSTAQLCPPKPRDTEPGRCSQGPKPEHGSCRHPTDARFLPFQSSTPSPPAALARPGQVGDRAHCAEGGAPGMALDGTIAG